MCGELQESITRWPSRKAVEALVPIRSGRTPIPERKISAAADHLVREMSELQERGGVTGSRSSSVCNGAIA